MQLINTKTQKLEADSVVCLGFFDGVHLGHGALLHKARDIAQKEGYCMCVHTFDTSPSQQIRKDASWFELTLPSRKHQLIAQSGCQFLAVSSFDERMRTMKGKDFFEKILLKVLRAKVIITGWNHRFGHKGDTDIRGLQTLCEEHGVVLHVVQKVSLPSGENVSSTAIRKALLCGEINLAEKMLGRVVDEDTIKRCQNVKQRGWENE